MFLLSDNCRRQVSAMLLYGGDTKSQARDIATAKRLWAELKGKAFK